jgi:diguanylate cyclase (GGDEF)-like protein
MTQSMLNKILLVDDNSAIHDDFRKIFSPQDSSAKALDKTWGLLFGTEHKSTTTHEDYLLDSAYQGQEGLKLVKQAIARGTPYALAFVDMRMPPGWDGIKTIKKIWEVDPEIQIVICSAHSDYSWEEISKELDGKDRLLILKKPFDVIEVRQLASALVKKWELNREVQFQFQNLENLVHERTAKLDDALALAKDTIESTLEGILVLDDDKKILSYNQNLIELWNLPKEEILPQNSLELLKEIAGKIKEPSAFLPFLIDLCQNPAKMIKEIKLFSEQIFELYVQPRYRNDVANGLVLSFRDVTEQKKLEEQLTHLATHDALTQLPNRLILIDRLQQAINNAKRNKFYVAFLMVDLDNFKRINDTLGHKAGDEVLKQFSKRLLNFFRESDTVTRFGGDEFSIILPIHLDLESITIQAEKLKKLFMMPFTLENNKQPINITGCVGISVYPMDGNTPEELLKNADSALYYAKKLGFNNYTFYASEISEKLIKQLEIETDLNQALKNDEFILFYQPLIHLDSHKIIGAEALIRWNHPKLGFLHPLSFIPIAERTNVIIDLGKWVLKKACEQGKIWRDTIHPTFIMAVNISSKQIMDENFIHYVDAVLKETGLEPQALELEITENTILEDSDVVSKCMLGLKKRGITLAMDDFGVGYSSLNYIKCFPFDKIKIDQSFTQGLGINPDDQHIIQAIISMTQSLGLEVLAEGVETKEQLDYLREYHGSQIQGYYISPPIHANDFPTFVNNFKQAKK